MPDYRLPDGAVPVLLSSDTADGLRAEAAAVLSYLERHERVTPDAVADMLFRTRIARRRRALAMVRTRDDLIDALRAVVADAPHSAVVSTVGLAAPRRVGFVFPGQGSQRPGMGRSYYENSPEYRAEVDACVEIHEQRYGHIAPLHYLLGHEGKYQDIVWEVQPALMFHMVGLAAMWQAYGVRPVATIGHSQGELAAGWISGVMTRRDAVLAVTHRARLVDDIVPPDLYSMAVLGMDRESCEALLARHSGWAELSVVNAPHILAISGDQDTITEMVAMANAAGKFAKEIKVSYPAHTSYLIKIREEMESMLGDEMSAPTFSPTEITCYGATLGGPITPDITHRQYWYWNLRNRVRFDRAVVASTAEVDTFIEVAEHPTLQLALQENLATVPDDPATGPRDFQVLGTSRRTAVGLEDFTRNLATLAVHDLNYDWQSLKVAGSAVRLPLPNFPHTQMSPKRLWAHYGSAAETVAAAEVAPVRLVENWTRLSRRTLTPPRTVTVVDRDGRCADLAAALRERAERHGATVTMFDGSPVEQADTVVVLVPPSGAPDEAAAVAEFADFATDQGWLAALGPRVTECWLVTAGAEAVGENEIPALAAAAAGAAFRCVALERIGVTFRRIDLPADYPALEQKLPADKILEAVQLAGEPELAMRDGKLHAKRLVVAEQAPTTAAPDLDEVLILGGTGHVGLEFCAQFVRDGARRVTLVNRSGETAALTEKLRAVRALGNTEIDVLACDISDPATVAGLAARHAERPVSLLAHAAVDYVYSAATDADAAAVAQAGAAKVVGFGEVLRALPTTPTATVLLCSSFAATLGGWGQALYAGTNRMLDAMALRLRAEGRACTSVQWGLWVLPAEADAAVEARIEGSGLLPMAAADAVAAGLADTSANSLVLAADWSKLRAVTETVGLAAVFAPALDALAEQAPAPTLAPAAEPVRAETTAAPVISVPSVPEAGFAERIRRALDRVMLSDGSEAIDGSVPLVSLGMDSLQALDLRKRIKAELNRDLPVAAILGGASLDDVVSLMSENKG
ncbi:mycobactin polyketide synthetase MbtD [Nocardia amikacinitolerans]|uniref:nocobactin polyketide synthase NbtC n=1 Tax=Nocardia amikacinitolerans TaxID=756689 RepID=UPI000A04EBAF|nr:nocobactin polyketide synthase NbtC [Nocardia amikacinitolerans]MCP2317518.1 mycobactin polyketide synthetase MbtD [Nocardia amikacinitolerans]